MANTIDIDQILTARGENYGDFYTHALVTQRMKDALQLGNSWHRCTCAQKEALEMIAHKIGRIVNGDPSYQDSWTDIIGYARLIEDVLEPAPTVTDLGPVSPFKPEVKYV